MHILRRSERIVNIFRIAPMFAALQVLTVIFVAASLAFSLSHALEFPGKMRLSREQYFAVQTIYYPGFTIGGGAEPIGLLLTFLLVLLTPAGSAVFWLKASAFGAFLAMHTTYWFLTHPVTISGSRNSN